MNRQTTTNVFEDIKVNVKIKLATLWASVMFLYIYVDHFHLYMPGMIDDILKGRVFEFGITKGFLLAALFSMTIPALMIFLSVALSAKVNRRLNIIIGSIFIPYTLFNLVGVAWIHMVFAAVVEVALLCLIVYHAWKWPRIEK
ncbi:MAG TPA: DUF6326 family protein [Bacteroidia bacterium]